MLPLRCSWAQAQAELQASMIKSTAAVHADVGCQVTALCEETAAAVKATWECAKADDSAFRQGTKCLVVTTSQGKSG